MTMLLVTKANHLLSSLPLYLTKRIFSFRTICSGKLGFMSDLEVSESSSPYSSPFSPYCHPLPGTKVLESLKEEFEIGNQLISFETGKIARFANGAVVMAMEETKVLSTVASSKGDAIRDFSLMCIGQDVSGNIKLSLKATQPEQGITAEKVLNGSVPSSNIF